MLRYVGAIVALIITFSSCESDFELTGQYEETPLIYGIMDPTQPVQLFRIQKAFLGEESAFVMAQNPDSSYFKYEELFVELVEYDDDGDELNRWALDTVVIFNKDTGNPDDDEIDFFGPTQRLYSTANDKILEATGTATVSIDVENQYEITLKKKPVGMTSNMSISNMDTVTPIADSRISVVDATSFRFTTPSDNGALVTAQRMTLVNPSGDLVPYNIKFNGAQNAAEYEVWLRFHYREVRDNVETPKSIEWLVARVQSNGAPVIQAPVPAEQIYNRIGSEIPAEENVIRKVGQADVPGVDPYPGAPDGRTQDFDVFVRIAGEALYEYIDINNQSNTGVVLDKPVYTNVNNGLGLFSSRTSASLEDRIFLSSESLNYLVGGPETAGRGFVVDPN